MKLKGRYLLVIALCMVIGGTMYMEQTGTDIGIYFMMIGIFIVFPAAVIVGIRNWWKKINSPEYNAKLAASQAEAQQRAAEQAEYKARRAADLAKRYPERTIVEVKPLGPGAWARKCGGLSGAMVGALTAGPLGAVVGAVLPTKGERLQRFAVRYADGHIEVKDLSPNNWEYKKLMKYVKWEDIQ